MTANSDNLALQEQLQEHIDRTAQLEELVTQLETERDDEIKGLEEKLRAEIESLEQALSDADELREEEVTNLEDQLEAARSSSDDGESDSGSDGGDEVASLQAKVEQKNKKLRFVAQQLEERDAEVIKLRDSSGSLETELVGLRKILARKKASASEASVADLAALTPQLTALHDAASKLDAHLSAGVDDWKQLELNISAAVSLLLRETSKKRNLQRIVNPILEELQAGLERGRKIVKEGQALAAKERETISELTDSVDKS